MVWRQWVLGWVLVSAATAAGADTLYRCRAYSGGLFWSREPCAAHQALLEREVSVPSGLGYERQVQVAEQGLRGSAGSAPPQPPPFVPTPSKAALRHAHHCERLRAELDRQVSLSRLPSSAKVQERIRRKQEHLRDEIALGAC